MYSANDKNKIIKLFLDNNDVKTRELNNLGFNSHDIKKMCDEELIYRESRGHYKVVPRSLADYIKKKYESRNDNFESVLCKSYKMYPGNTEILLQALALRIRDNRFEDAFKIFDYLFRNEENERYRSGLYTMLILFGNLIPISDGYKNILVSISENDVLFPGNKDDQYVDMVNKLRHSIYNYNFNLSSLHNEYASKFKVDLVDYIIFKLAKKVTKRFMISINKIRTHLDKEDIDGLYDYVNTKKDFYYSTIAIKFLTYVLKYLKDGDDIENIPTKGIMDTFIKNLLLNGNYDEAKRYIRSLILDNGICDIAYSMLDMISKYKAKERFHEYNVDHLVMRDATDSLALSDIDAFFEKISIYYDGCSDNIKLASYLLALYEYSEIDYTSFMYDLVAIKNGEFSIDHNYYIERVKELLHEKNVVIAGIYLDIMRKCSYVNDSEFEYLHGIYKDLKARTTYTEHPFKIFKKLYRESRGLGVDIHALIKNGTSTISEYEISKIGTSVLSSKNFYLFERVKKTSIRNIINYASRHDELSIKVFTYDNDDYVLLKYNSGVFGYRRLDGLSKVKNYTIGKDYYGAINALLDIIRNMSDPYPALFDDLAELYMKVGNYKLARMCYILASQNMSNNKKVYECEDAIYKANKGRQSDIEDIRQSFKYVDAYINDIYNLICMGLTVEDALSTVVLTRTERICALVLLKYKFDDQSQFDNLLSDVDPNYLSLFYELRKNVNVNLYEKYKNANPNFIIKPINKNL